MITRLKVLWLPIIQSVLLFLILAGMVADSLHRPVRADILTNLGGGGGGGGTGPSINQNIRAVGGSFDGGGTALSAGKITYVTVPFACTVSAYNIVVDTGTVSFDVWKVATGTAIPTISNTILSGGYLAISSGTALHSTSTTLFTTTAVSANDILGVNLEAVSGATVAQLVLQCNATT
jgi:hypothetical protein